jgi:hypothetical protein
MKVEKIEQKNILSKKDVKSIKLSYNGPRLFLQSALFL